MSDGKMRELCSRISAEKDSAKLQALTEELLKLLNEEQQAIRSRIKANVGTSTARAD